MAAHGFGEVMYTSRVCQWVWHVLDWLISALTRVKFILSTPLELHKVTLLVVCDNVTILPRQQRTFKESAALIGTVCNVLTCDWWLCFFQI